jgi:HEAT repeat protein
MGTVMKRLGVSEADAAEVIRTSLASNEREAVFAALAVIQDYPADEYAAKLVTIALDPNSIVPHGSVYVLAMHRTDEGVAALRKLLSDPDPDVRKNTLSSIRAAYRAHPCYPEQADEVYTKTLVSIAANPDNPYRYDVIREIVQTRTREGVAAIRKLLVDPNAGIPLTDTDLGVRAIRDLLRDDDPDVREIARYCVKWAGYETPGRALWPDDFPAEYEEIQARRRMSVEKWLQAD